MARIDIDLPQSLLEELERRAQRSGQSRGQAIAGILAQHFGETLHTVFQVSTSGRVACWGL